MSSQLAPAMFLRQVLLDALLRAGRASPLLWLAVLVLAALVLPSQYAGHTKDQEALRQAQIAQSQRSQAALQSSATDTAQPLSQRERSQRNVAQFKVMLAQAPLPEGAQKTLFALATRWRLELPQGQYKQACDESGAWCSYRMQLPVVGEYAAVRGFVQEALHALPSLALDGASFKREGAAAAELEVVLRWTLYQAPVRASGEAP